MDLSALLDEVTAESDALDARVADLADEEWATPTPAEGWDIRDSIGHLAFFDDMARLALTDEAAFAAQVEAMASGAAGRPDEELSRSHSPSELLARWRAGRGELIDRLREAEPGSRVPWYGPPMSVPSFATARLMETWAHGQDVADALGLPPVATDRLRHVCHIGIGARPYSFMVHSLTDPGDPIRIELALPSGEQADWGPAGAANRVTGGALEFALLVTCRRHLDDTDLVIAGPVAQQWISIAQSFAGPRGTPRPAGLFEKGNPA